MVKTQKKNNKDTSFDEEDDNEAMIIITSKLQHVLAAKSRRLQYLSSPVTSNNVSLSLLSSPDDSLSRASIPFSWEEEPGKPKHHVRHPSYSKCLDLPPRMLLPDEFTKMPLKANHRRRLARWKRWFRWKKERGDDDYVAGSGSFIYPSEDEGDMMKTTRTRGLHCVSYITRCCLWVN
ncbi:hypothetical protein ISN44_As10g031690 [Arabidopsis suecica]|uniref:Uncharacterized protein n=1 Tax=Arabidopsis suecica TaxID=45249 RepID=A0A8T2A4Y2_ARASU|nr:hypothetical protein ISN44_As10g031690 [Arabidopsis suecica]